MIGVRVLSAYWQPELFDISLLMIAGFYAPYMCATDGNLAVSIFSITTRNKERSSNYF